jgi:hypothetical protein
MRVFELPFKGKAVATAQDQVGAVLLHNMDQENWPQPQASVILYAVMVWPNDEKRRNLFLDAWTATYGGVRRPIQGILDRNARLFFAGRLIDLRELGGTVIDHLDKESEAAQKAWKNTGDLLISLARLHANPHSAIRGGASISKARDLIDASRGGANRQRLEQDWVRYQSVAHLAAANTFLAALGLAQTNDDPRITSVSPVFSDPGSVLCLALRFQNFGLSFIPAGRKDPIMDGEFIWRVPERRQFAAAPFGPGPLTAEEIEVLASRTARRGRRTGARI